MKNEKTNQYDVLDAQQLVDNEVLKANMLLTPYRATNEKRRQLFEKNGELQGPDANLFTSMWVIAAILAIMIYQVNVDGALFAEQILGNATTDLINYPWYFYLLVVSLCLIGFFSAEGVSRSRYINDKFGRKVIHNKWLIALAGVILYVSVHAYLGLYMSVNGGVGSAWSTILPCFVAFMDLVLGLMFGSIVALTLRLAWLDFQIARLLRQLRRAAQRVSKAQKHFWHVVGTYYETNSTDGLIPVELADSMQAATEFQKQFRVCLGLPSPDHKDENPPTDNTLDLPQEREPAD